MNYQVKNTKYQYGWKIKDYWSDDDYVQLLGSLLIQKHLVPKNLSELLSMAITDFEPNEAAAIGL
jgi:hypothetical protein